MEDPKISIINMVYNTQHSKIHDDPIDSMHEEPLIEKIIEGPPQVTSTENSDNWECFHDYFSDDDHICTPDLPQDETITESYSETYDENHKVHDGTPTCSPYNDDSLEDLLPCDLFLKKMILIRRRTSIAWDVMPAMKTLSYPVWMGVMTIGISWKIYSMRLLKK